MHDMLGTMVEKATTMVAALQQIHDEQQDCLYKLEVVAGIRSADAQLPPLPTPFSTTYPPSPSATVHGTLGEEEHADGASNMKKCCCPDVATMLRRSFSISLRIN
jgi:hypothetical protein